MTKIDVFKWAKEEAKVAWDKRTKAQESMDGNAYHHFDGRMRAMIDVAEKLFGITPLSKKLQAHSTRRDKQQRKSINKLFEGVPPYADKDLSSSADK